MNLYKNLKVKYKCIVFDNAPHHNNHLSPDALKIFYAEIINAAYDIGLQYSIDNNIKKIHALYSGQLK